MKWIIIFFITLITLFVTIMLFFGKSVYRYQCQDPINWSTPDCEPPICKASGTCTEDTLKVLVKKEKLLL
jgi:hypothetical protein